MYEADFGGRGEVAGATGEARTLGSVVAIEGWKVTGVLDDSMPRNLEYGGLLKIHGTRSTVYGIVDRLWLQPPDRPPETARPVVEIELIGEISKREEGGRTPFQRGVLDYPVLGDGISTVTANDIALIYARPRTSCIVVGTIHHGSDQPAYIMTDNLLGKHFAILGTTGSGKSCSVALVLRSILESHPNGHIVLLDPHDEYANAFDDRAEVITPENLLLPYWLMNFEEAVATFVSREGSERDTEIRILKDAILGARREYASHHNVAGRVTVDAPIPYYLKDLQQIIDQGMGKLDKPEGAVPYMRLLARVDALLSDNRLSLMFPDAAVHDTMADILARIVRVPVSGKPITIIDLSGVPSEVVDVVVSMLCRMIFDFGVWSAEQQKVPLLLVCEEAHRYVPHDQSTSFEPTRRAIARIAKEGRKYGIGLCLVSQRPSELSETVLSQCNTIFAMRLSNHHDQEFVRRTLPDGMAGLVSALPALHTQEAIVVGDGVSIPTRFRFGDLDAAHRPRSRTAFFSKAWQEEVAEETFVRETMNRWRAQR